MLILIMVDGLSLAFAVVFLKCRSDINMLQVAKRMQKCEPKTLQDLQMLPNVNPY